MPSVLAGRWDAAVRRADEDRSSRAAAAAARTWQLERAADVASSDRDAASDLPLAVTRTCPARRLFPVAPRLQLPSPGRPGRGPSHSRSSEVGRVLLALFSFQLL